MDIYIFDAYKWLFSKCSSSSSEFYFSVGYDTILFMFDIYYVVHTRYNTSDMSRTDGASWSQILRASLIDTTDALEQFEFKLEICSWDLETY